MSTTPFPQSYTAEHSDARRALHRHLSALDVLIKATDWRSPERNRQNIERDIITRKLRSLHSQAPGTALLWKRKAEQQLAKLTFDYPELVRLQQQQPPKPRKLTRRQRITVLLEERKDRLAAMKKKATGDLKQQISLEYNRTDNWLGTLPGMSTTRISTLLEQLQEEDLSSLFAESPNQEKTSNG